jgi:hypothetical protein
VDWLVASQAQDYAGAKWALGLRMQNAVDAALDQALAEGSILRTHVLRPTWHFATPADIRWLLALSAPRVHAINAYMYRQQQLDSATLKRSTDTLAGALMGGRQLIREDLKAVLERSGIEVGGGLRLAYIVMAAELDGVICSGARRGRQFTYALLDERAPHARLLEPEQALAELARRYFTSRGPTTVHDFAKWSGLTVSDARNGLAAVEDQFERGVLKCQEYWFPPSMPSGEGREPTTWLMSTYDEYISSYKDRSAIADDDTAARLAALENALRFIVVVDGRIVGVWKPIRMKSSLMIETDFFRPQEEAVDQAMARAFGHYAAFFGLDVV